MLQMLKRSGSVTTLALALAVTAPDAQAISASDRQILEDFFVQTDGENWLRKDGWLNPDVHPCDWYGIDCAPWNGSGEARISRILLPGNQLGGTLDTRIFEIVGSALDLRDNRIGGTLERLPSSPGSVDLSGNRLSGPLPDQFSDDKPLSGPDAVDRNWYLDLSNNNFEGEVPADWPGTVWLSLAGNRLEGMPASLFRSPVHPLGGRFLDLSDNRFSGQLPQDLIDTAFLPHNGDSRWGGGLNLCWNDFEIEGEDLIERIGARHVGGDNFRQCIKRERLPLAPSLSGSWFDPQRGGEGVVFHQLADNRALLYWFTFDEEGNQRWLVGTGSSHEFGADWRELLQTRGHFGLGFSADDEAPATELRGGFRLDRIGDDTLMAERSYIDTISNICLAIYPPPLGCFGSGQSDRLQYERLTELAGSRCDNSNPYAGYSGTWFNPQRNGEGFVIEVLPNGNAALYWFTHEPGESGAQAWMLGVGELSSQPGMPGAPALSRLVIDELYLPRGARFGRDFDPTDIELLEWGSLSVSFTDEESGWVEWNSHDAAFGSGSYEIERLTQPLLADCGDGQ